MKKSLISISGSFVLFPVVFLFLSSFAFSISAEKENSNVVSDNTANKPNKQNNLAQKTFNKKIKSRKLSVFEYQEIFAKVFSLIHNNYVEDVSEEKLMQGAINGLVSVLNDHHSHYLNPNQMMELSISTSGNFGGIGIEVSIRNKQLLIVSPLDGSPARQAGLLPGDIIVKINDQPVKKIGLKKAFILLRGKVGEGIRLYIKRKDIKELLDFYIVRANIKLKVLDSRFIPKTKIAYIKLKQFSRSSFQDIQKVLLSFKKKKAKAIILDLRWNPGGLLQEAKNIADLFLSEGKRIVYTKGRMKNKKQEYFSTNEVTVFPKLPMVVLVNRGSASSSEIVAGALKDNKRAKIVGQRTFGKASVQYVYSLPYGCGLTLTIQRYYTPSGKMIQNKGIVPDIIVKPEIFLSYEQKALNKLRRSKLMKTFFEKNKKYDVWTLNTWKNELKKNGIVLSSKTAEYILINQINKLSLKKSSLINLKFDSQLRKAIEILKQ